MGGGTTVNWACCIETPDYVRKEWADAAGIHKLTQFCPDSVEYNRAIASVASRIGANETGIVHNEANSILLDGAAKLGWQANACKQNFRDPADPGAGWSCFGDRDENKQGTLATYLLDAAAAGAKFVHCCAVEKILTHADAGSIVGQRACGVRARLNSGKVLEVNARRCVVLSAGALHTPCVLLRSGLSNAHIGRHLHLVRRSYKHFLPNIAADIAWCSSTRNRCHCYFPWTANQGISRCSHDDSML